MWVFVSEIRASHGSSGGGGEAYVCPQEKYTPTAPRWGEQTLDTVTCAVFVHFFLTLAYFLRLSGNCKFFGQNLGSSL